MNRRDTALIAHLDAIETRWQIQFDAFQDRLWNELRLIREDVAGIKMELATHRHDDD